MNRADARTSSQPRWRLALVLFAAAPPCLVAACTTTATYGPGSGTLTGIIRPCTPKDVPGTGWHFAQVVTVRAKTQDGRTAATQRFIRRNRLGVRYRLRALAGSYQVGASSKDDSAGVEVTVTAHRTTTVNFTGGGGCA
jgi:hypothetical protein